MPTNLKCTPKVKKPMRGQKFILESTKYLEFKESIIYHYCKVQYLETKSSIQRKIYNFYMDWL